MLNRLIQELNNQAGHTMEKEPQQMVERVNELVVCLERVISIGKTPVLVIDGVEKIKKSTKVEKVLLYCNQVFLWFFINIREGKTLVKLSRQASTLLPYPHFHDKYIY